MLKTTERFGEMRKRASEQKHDEVRNRGRQAGSGHPKCQNFKFPTAARKEKLDNGQIQMEGGRGQAPASVHTRTWRLNSLLDKVVNEIRPHQELNVH